MVSPLLTQSPDAGTEQRQGLLHGADWKQYIALLDVLGDNFPTLRLSYLEGGLEIITDSSEYEDLKKRSGMLVKAYLQETRTRFRAGGSMTFRKAAKHAV